MNKLGGFALVGLGGATGAMLRHAVNLVLQGGTWPRATLLVNVLGCLVFGLIAGLTQGKLADPVRFLLVTGVLGGFTTFSAFGGEAAALLRTRPLAAALYAGASVALGVLAVLAGERLGRILIS
jgi:CrcB protein